MKGVCKGSVSEIFCLAKFFHHGIVLFIVVLNACFTLYPTRIRKYQNEAKVSGFAIVLFMSLLCLQGIRQHLGNKMCSIVPSKLFKYKFITHSLDLNNLIESKR